MYGASAFHRKTVSQDIVMWGDAGSNGIGACETRRNFKVHPNLICQGEELNF